jgi:hypothetical protein
MDRLLSARQTLAVVARLETPGLTYQQLRDLERRGCVAPKVMAGGRSPRVYGFGDVLSLRLIARMQADPLLRRWQVWSVVAHLREALTTALVAGHARVLVIQGARGQIVSRREASSLRGVDCDLSDLGRGVREAMRAECGDVWSGATWIPAREASALSRELALV